jgi:hypothetical protein
MNEELRKKMEKAWIAYERDMLDQYGGLPAHNLTIGFRDGFTSAVDLLTREVIGTLAEAVCEYTDPTLLPDTVAALAREWAKEETK